MSADSGRDVVTPPTPGARGAVSPRRPWLWILLAAGPLVLGAVVRELVLAGGN